MPDLSRRGLFGLFAGAIATPVLAKLTPFTPAAFTEPVYNLSLSDIVAVTLRARSGQIADNLLRVNPLFARMGGTSRGFMVRLPHA